jgi:hypothetical protein
MAARSVQYLPQASFHIIKCDKDGAIFIGPDGPGRRMVCHLKAAPGTLIEPSNQLGTGDVLAGALAVEIARMNFPDELRCDTMLAALLRSLAVVACYLQLDWQRVPNERELGAFKAPEARVSEKSTIADGLLLLPSASESIDLGEMSVEDSKLVSVDKKYKNVIKRLIQHLRTEWDVGPTHLKSAILTGRGGVGKSEIKNILTKKLDGIKVLEWTASECTLDLCPNVPAAIAKLQAARHTAESDGIAIARNKLVIIIDEAFAKVGHLVFEQNGKMLLQLANEITGPTRFYLLMRVSRSTKETISSSGANS